MKMVVMVIGGAGERVLVIGWCRGSFRRRVPGTRTRILQRLYPATPAINIQVKCCSLQASALCYPPIFTQVPCNFQK